MFIKDRTRAVTWREEREERARHVKDKEKKRDHCSENGSATTEREQSNGKRIARREQDICMMKEKKENHCSAGGKMRGGGKRHVYD
jgi:hypothetical protein